jgi:hypothetical protein
MNVPIRNEVVIVPTYNRPEMLYCCLRRIRDIEPQIEVHVFPDHAGVLDDPDLSKLCLFFGAWPHLVPKHNYYGNTFNTMEAFREMSNMGFSRFYYVEDDVFVHENFFKWHRKMHEEFDDIFASMAWVFNRQAPIEETCLFQPWYYSVGTCFTQKKLLTILPHCTPLYYGDMAAYIQKEFPESAINFPHAIAHYEQDGLIQRVLDRDKSQTVTSGIAKCSHLGFGGYNRGWNGYEAFFRGEKVFRKRVQRIEALVEDPYWRISLFDREIVEREFGHAIPERKINYKMQLPGGWSTEFVSEMTRDNLPRRIRSVPVPAEAEFVVE